jgi:hypothetical protein
LWRTPRSRRKRSQAKDGDLPEGEPVRAQRLVEQALAERDRLVLLRVLHEVADLRARLAGARVGQPGRVGVGVGGGDDLDLVAIAQLAAQRHQVAVDAAGHAAVADVGMHRVGEVDRGRALGHREDLALGREHVDLAGEEVDLDVLEELGGLARGRLQLEQRLQPGVRLLLQLGEGLLVFLVQPVRGHAGLGDVVHLAGADLHLDRHAEGTDQGGVQALVAVGLGDGQ